MNNLILYFDFGLLVLDLVTIADLRKFLTDFLAVKRNVKRAKEIHEAHFTDHDDLDDSSKKLWFLISFTTLQIMRGVVPKGMRRI